MKKKPLTNKSGRVRELTSKDIRVMRPASEVLPAKLVDALPKRQRGERGPQKKPKKILLTKRYDQKIVIYFKSTGKGWQTRIDEVLTAYMKKHPKPIRQEQHEYRRHTKHQYKQPHWSK